MSKRKATDGTRLRPCLKELFRTCVHPPSIVLSIEHIAKDAEARGEETPAVDELNAVPPSRQSGQWLRLFVSDGELQVQAVLQKHLVYKNSLKSLQEGALIEVRRFEVRKARRTNGSGSIVYLGILDFDVSSQNSKVDFDKEGGFFRESASDQSVQNPHLTPTKTKHTGMLNGDTISRALEAIDNTEQQAMLEGGEITALKKRVHIVEDVTNNPSELTKPTMSYSPEPNNSTESDEDMYETMLVNPTAIVKRRRILHNLKRIKSHPAMSKTSSPKLDISKNDNDIAETPETINEHSKSSETYNHVELIPLNKAPVHTLASLLDRSSELPKRNYVCTIFAVISWTSPSIIHRRNSPFPPKRHIKLHDPTIAARHAGVSVAVFVDAKSFRPQVGTVALFRGLTMQKWEGEVILNAYESLKRAAEPWFIDDNSELVNMGFDVEGLIKWWNNRTARTA